MHWNSHHLAEQTKDAWLTVHLLGKLYFQVVCVNTMRSPHLFFDFTLHIYILFGHALVYCLFLLEHNLDRFIITMFAYCLVLT